MSTSGRRLLSAIINEGDVSKYLKLDLYPELFKEGELVLYQTIHNHLAAYGKIITPTTLEQMGMADAIVDAPEPAKYYLDETRKRFLHNSLKAGVQEVSSLLTSHNPEEALAALTKVVMNQHKVRNKRHVTDFRDAHEIVYKMYLAQKQAPSLLGLPYGWETLDEMTGGARAGDFNTIIGRPMMGKTFLMLYAAHRAWKAGRTPLFVTMEMLAGLIHNRLAAMDVKVKLTDLMKAELSTKAFNTMMQKLTDLQHAQKPLWVVDNTVVQTVDDLVMQAMILGADSIFVDAAYLLKRKDKKIGKWEAQNENAEEMKQRVASDLEVPVTASYQFSKGAKKEAKKNKDYEMGMEDVHGSDAMAQLSTVMLGLFDFEGEIEAMKKRTVRILKGRNGETGSFDINWDFSAKMDFSEVKKEAIEEMQLDHLG